MEIIRHHRTWLELDELGAPRPYLPTFGTKPFINEAHRRFSHCARSGVAIEIGIRGALRREDALKLYEIAYHTAGDGLELGTGEGLSAAILGEAILASGRRDRLVTVDRNRGKVDAARANLRAWGVGNIVDLICEEAEAACRRLVGQARTFGFVFIDHSPAYTDVARAARHLDALLREGGFALFHDFNDRRNIDGDATGYEVYRAVRDELPSRSFSFYGVFGATALYRKDSSRG